MDSSKKIYRSEKDKVIAGVCAGLAEYLNVDVTLVRLVFLAGAFLGFSSTIWIYLAMWLIVPVEPSK